jgi:hypothetical protein
MKSIEREKGSCLRTTTKSDITGRYSLDSLKEHAMVAIAWSVGIAVIVSLYAVMLVALYRWSRDAPIYSDGGASAIEEALSSSR